MREIDLLVTIMPFRGYFEEDRNDLYAGLRKGAEGTEVDCLDFNKVLAGRYVPSLLSFYGVEEGRKVLGMSTEHDLVEELYLKESVDPMRHLNELGNQVVAEELVRYLLADERL